MVRVEVQLSADEAALVVRACETSAETPNRADGLMAIVQATLRGDEPTRPPVELTVHVDADTLVGDAGGLSISPETCGRLLCDAAIVPITEDARGTPLSVGRRTRSIPTALRRALLARDGHCQFPGCDHRRFVEGHHIQPWCAGGETNMLNLLILCTFHHQWLHEEGYTVARGEDGFLFFAPGGKPVVARKPEPTMATSVTSSISLIDYQVPPPPEWESHDYAELMTFFP